jgi:hypothetical protein
MAQATVTMASPAAKQRVIDLIRAVSYHSTDQGACTWLTLRSDDSNSTGIIYVGDSGVTTSNYGTQLLTAMSETWNNGKGCNDVDLMNKFVLGSAESLKLNIQWEYT